MDRSDKPQFGILTPDQRVRVFISSTLGELKEERRAVHAAVTDDLKLHSVMFESGASPHPPRERYRALLDQSHIYVGIFWQSYGWVASDMSISGIEDEYNFSEGKTRLVYIKSPALERDPRLQQLLDRMENDSNFCYAYFSTIEELVELIKNDLQFTLSEAFLLGERSVQSEDRQATAPPSYLSSLCAEMERQPLVERKYLSQNVLEKLEAVRRLVLSGDPGVGKTYLLGQIGVQTDAIYISLRNKTTQQVFAHIANHLALRRDQIPQSLPSEVESREALQSELSFSSVTILIDHADQNIAVTQALMGLEYFACRVLFSSRPNMTIFLNGIEQFPMPSFDREEIQLFLQGRNLVFPPGDIQKLVAASQGNALYLDYFAQQQISPLPQGLTDYQGALWRQLSPEQQNFVILVATSLVPLQTSDVHALAQQGQETTELLGETKRRLEETVPLLRRVNKFWEVFHPYFQEYVISEVTRDGSLEHYHQTLGEYALVKQRIVATAFHFLRAGDGRADKYLEQAANVALLQGDWPRAEEFLARALELAKGDGDLHDEAQVYHALAQVYGESGRRREASDAAQNSMRLFDQIGDEDQKRIVELYGATLLIEEGRADEAITTLENAVTAYHDMDEHKEAVALLNLSYAYLQVARGHDGADVAQRALDIFTKIGDERGTRGALGNISACVGLMDSGDLEQQKQWAERVIATAEKQNDARFKALGLNHLARVQRRANDPIAAQKSCEEAIALCQQTGALDAELSNIANLGNALLDQDLIEEAERAYTEALLRAQEHHLKHNEAHALELLAKLKFKQGLDDQAIGLGERALAMFKHFGDVLRIASTQDKLARSYGRLGRQEEAAQTYEDSGRHYETAKEWGDAAYGYQQAAALWNTLNHADAATRCALQGAHCALRDDDPHSANNSLIEADETRQEVGELFTETLGRFLQNANPVNFTGFMTNFASFCKRQSDPQERERFKVGLGTCIGALSSNATSQLMNGLAIGLEQADEGLLPVSELDGVAERIADAVDHLYYRAGPDEPQIWTIGLEWQEPLVVQIVCLSNDPIAQRIAISLSLILIANKEAIEDVVNEFGGNQENSLAVQVVMQDELRTRGVRIPSDENEHIHASVSESNVPWEEQQPPTIIIIHNPYETAADWSKNPGNKAFLWILMNIFRAVVGHCAHKKHDYAGFKGKASNFCDLILK